MKKNHRILKIARDILVVFGILFTVCFVISRVQPTVVMDESEAQTWAYYDEYSVNLKKARALLDTPAEPQNPPGFDGIFENLQKRIEGDSRIQNVTEPTPETVNFVDEAKGMIRLQLGVYKDLHWDTFDSIDVKECDLPEGTGIVIAFYLPDENRIYVVRDMKKGTRKDLEITVHELIHSLTCTPETEANYMLEGATEYLAQQIVPTGDYSYDFAYPFAEAYDLIHGRDALVKALLENTLMDKIDQDLGRPVMEDVNQAIAGSIYGFSRQPMYVVMDVYCHYVAKYELHVNSTMRDMLRSSKFMEDETARKYFMSILSWGILI